MEGLQHLGEVSSLAIKGVVMVVDDNPPNLRLMNDILQSCGYEVRSFPKGRMALRAASEIPPDLILLDINMPEMTGYEVCTLLKSNARLSKIPVIFISAMDAFEDRLRGFQSGGVDYISKPFQFEEVQARVGAHVKLRHCQQEIETDNFRLQELVQSQVKKLADAQMETIFNETGRHLERVQIFCKLLGIGLSHRRKYEATVGTAWIRNLFHASPLHDIGKVAVPDRILLKSGRLTPEEFAIMKTHAALGAQTLLTVHARYPDNEFVEMGIKITRSHHEKWDGTGYPEGLAGEEIPLCARVLSVADHYDALRSSRCYKSAIPHEETCSILLRESGTHLDPAVIEVFSEISDTFRDVWNWMGIISDGGAGGPLPEDSLVNLRIALGRKFEYAENRQEVLPP